jgi:hypothetical protein
MLIALLGRNTGVFREGPSVTLLVPPSSVLRPELRRPLEHFVQAAFSVLAADVVRGQEVPFALGGGGGLGGPRLYDYRPLYRAYVEERAERLLDLADGRAALAALEGDPGVLAYAEAHAPGSTHTSEAVRRSVLVPLLVGVAERCDGFDFDVDAFDAVYGAVERGVTAAETRVSAFTPLAGVLLSNPPADLGAGVTLRRASLGEIGARWPEASGLVPEGFGREPDQLLYLDLELSVRKGERHQDAAGLVAHAVTALRLATGARIAAGPLLFEAVDGAHRSVRALPPLAAATPSGDVVRLDANSLAAARALSAALAAPAPVRLEAALAQHGAGVIAAGGGIGRLVASLAIVHALLDGERVGDHAVALRVAALRGATAGARMRIVECFADAAHVLSGELDLSREELEGLVEEIDGAARATLLAALLDGRANEDLGDELDGVLLGARPRPRSVPEGLPGLVSRHTSP